MLLDIVVTHYREEWAVIRPFFDMLHAQKEADFGKFRLIFVQDGPIMNLFPEGYFKDSKIYGPSKMITIPHSGVSAARNAGLDSSDAEWVMFCDCDDCFTSIYSLMKIFHILESPEAENADLIWAPFYISGNGGISIRREMNYVFIHSKIYRRSFLKEHDIRFPEGLHMSEDSAFNTLVRLEIPAHRTIEITNTEPLYAWCRRKGSITMDFSKWLKNTEGHFDRNLFVLEEYRKRGLTGWELTVGRTITDVYSMLNKEGVPPASKRFLEKVRMFYQENKEAFENVDQEKLQMALAASDRDIGVTEENKRARPELREWIQEVLEDG